MNPRNVIFTLLFILALLGIFVFRTAREPKAKESFDRTPDQIEYTRHARCRMNCRDISKKDIEQILKKGVINLSKSNRSDRPCPTFALQGTTSDGEYLRVVFAQCRQETRVVTAYNLKKEFKCQCP